MPARRPFFKLRGLGFKLRGLGFKLRGPGFKLRRFGPRPVPAP